MLTPELLAAIGAANVALTALVVLRSRHAPFRFSIGRNAHGRPVIHYRPNPHHPRHAAANLANTTPGEPAMPANSTEPTREQLDAAAAFMLAHDAVAAGLVTNRESAWFEACMGDLGDRIEQCAPDAYALSAVAPDLRAALREEMTDASILLLWWEREAAIKERAPKLWSVGNAAVRAISLDGQRAAARGVGKALADEYRRLYGA
ncbi:hypothetical protein [Burkholderia cepacia]|uniref:hypothetical protein n=1 Tax=Burkholderia cepacia TaxID=292 RepID=UPI00158CC1D9|nr:hypothetical protein [Burkholderia cepacia]